ncbi:MAG: cache domain-containing protein [Amphritea sp.]
MLFTSKLVQRFFITIIVIISVIFTAVYFYSVPLIKDRVFDIERTSSRIALDSVFALANKMYFDTEKYREQALESHKQRLKSVVSLTESYIQDVFQGVKRGELTQEAARQKVFSQLRNFKYGSNDYIWIADYNAVLLSHPDPRYHGADASMLVNNTGEASIPEIIKLAIDKGEGFYQYKWQRLAENDQQDKVSYVKSYPQWGFVVGSGVYLDDLEQEVTEIRNQALKELREGLKDIKIASTGYLFIFDTKTNMLIHPNPNIDGTNFLNLMNPVTKRSIADELIEVADSGQELYYKWDKPDDPGNYIYEKLSLVRYLPGFDWYICSSVYVDELRSSSELLGQRIMTVALGAIVIAALMTLFFVQWITLPIQRLADTARRVRGGELSAKSGIQRDDELGLLARTFDGMVDQLRDYIHNLDSKVERRTKALAEKNIQLQDASESMANAQQELSQIEERQRLILDALPAQIAYLDGELNYLFVNQGYADMFGQNKESVIGKPLASVIGDSLYADMTRQINAALTGRNTVQEYSLTINDKEIITKRTLIPCHNRAGEVNGLLTLAFDITAEKQAEQQLTEAQRMNAVGQLAGGLAHDFNNLLTIILGNLHSASERFEQQDELLNYLKPAMRATRRGADITSRLLSFSRRLPLSPSLIDLNRLISETSKLLQGSLPDNIRIIYQPQTLQTLPYADPGRLEDALVNLALNAKDAMPQGGTLTFRVSEREVTAPLKLDEDVLPGSYIEIQISDNGQGFTSEAQSQAYEPFFTTKSGGSGSGLGLSMVYGFIKQSRGYIMIHSEPGQGSSISLLLPARSAETVATEATPDPQKCQETSYSGKLVMLVEDDKDVRDVVRQQLLELGFDVIEAGNADEAEQLLPLFPNLYALVSDIMLPGRKNGIELANSLKQQSENNRIILISGYSYQQNSDIKIDPAFLLLEKPFDITVLAEAFRKLHTL